MGLPADHRVSRLVSYKDAVRSLDVVGMSLLVAFLALLITVLNLGGQAFPWSSPIIVELICTCCMSLLVFALVERNAEMPVAPASLFTTWKWRNVPIVMGESLITL